MLSKPASNYRLVHLASGAHSVHSLAHRETFHPVIGPVAEAEALYVNQLRLRERLQQQTGEFVIWDVGLGAAANVLTVLRATRDILAAIRLVSFDCTPEPLEFSLQHAAELGYFGGYEAHLQELLQTRRVSFQNDRQTVEWDLHLADFPTLLTQPAAQAWPKPHAILFDAFSPAKNPHMWTPQLFTSLFNLLDPARPCALPTYSRSTMLRVTLLLAGFYALADVWNRKRLFWPLVVIGTNSIAAYVLSWTMDNIDEAVYQFNLRPRTLNLFSPAPWSPALEPLCVGSLTLLIYWLILYAMYKKKIFLRI